MNHPRASKPRRQTKPARVRGKRRPDWTRPCKSRSLALQERITALLVSCESGLIVRELADTLGISRQLALYHLKKLAARAQIVMVLEPCAENGGLRFRCWDDTALALSYLDERPRPATMRPPAFAPAALGALGMAA